MKSNKVLKIGGVATLFLLLISSAKSYNVAKSLFKKWKESNENDQEYNKIIKSFWIAAGYSNEEANSFINSNIPWSTAFISYIMIKSGYTDFPKSKFNTCIAKKIQEFTYKNYALVNPENYSPKKGDILLKNMPGGGLSFQNFVCGDNSHSDIVTNVLPNSLETIGGDINNHIAKKRIQTDSTGKILSSSYFAIIKVN